MASSSASIESSPSPSTNSGASVSISSGCTSSSASASTISFLISASSPLADATVPPLLEIVLECRRQATRRSRRRLASAQLIRGADRRAYLHPPHRTALRHVGERLALHQRARVHADRDRHDVTSREQRNLRGAALERAQPFGRRARSLGIHHEVSSRVQALDRVAH